ncbi:MAG: two-component system sensor kinase [Symbiobacteriaceae bacterium]|jgi:signal transduction histidine kinase|nr:two-component system sensor kinase [Symbiobacteriaceae bacterium]
MDALSLRTRLFLIWAAMGGSPVLLMVLSGLIPWRLLWVLAPVAAVAYGAAAAVARPAEELLETAARLRAGELQAHALLPPNSALGPVAEAMHALAGDLAALSGRFEDRVRERTEALTRKAVQLRAVGQVGQQVAAVLEPEPLLHFVVRVMRGTFGYDVVAALRRQGDHLILAACAARNQEEVPLGRVYPVSGVLAGDGAPAPLAPGLAAAAQLAVPMRLGDRVVGALVVQSIRPGVFDSEDLFTVQTIAGQVAVALETARLFEAERGLRDLAIAEERNRMAREIHDTLAQGFMGIIMHLRAMQGAADPAAAGLHRDEAETLARESLQEARRSVWNLQPHRLEGKSLAEALAAEVAAVERRAALSAELTAQGDLPPLTPAAEAALLRIAQEALHNAMKYARASRVLVRLTAEANSVALAVEDDGIGFDPSAFGPERTGAGGGGFGLPGMAARAHALGGTLAVESAPGAGCRIIARIPAGRN